MKILHLEDSLDDAELIQAVLLSRWFDCTVTAVASKGAFERAARAGDFDLILSDFTIPGYTGLAALDYARTICPEKPFIFLSGTIGEERAIAAMKAGAADYVIKDRPARLIPAIEMALHHAERERAHRRAQEKILEQATFLDKACEAICVMDESRRIIYWNARAELLYGLRGSEAIGRDLRDVLHRADLGRFEAAYRAVVADGEWRGDLRPVRSSGETILVESFWSLVRTESGGPRKILIIEADITEKRRLENQLMQSQRLETLGMLAGGIAHDLNNMLAPILLTADSLASRAASAEDRGLIETLGVSAQHGVELVRQLLAFSRGQCEERGEVAVDALIGSVKRLLHGAMPRGVHVRVSLPRELWAIQADATQIRQVLLNLCLNARDAMPDGGMIEMRAEGIELDCGARSDQGEARGGRYVRISVADTGSGIPPHLLDKIFDPFFTTKDAAKGTGLGLVNVAGIVKSHGGFLTVDTELGVGSTFHIHLPAFIRADRRREEGPAGNSPLHGAGERILLVEDDESVGTALELMLITRGYRVNVVRRGELAMRELSEKPDEYQLVITDLHLGEMSGMEVLHHLRSIKSPPRVIIMSGARPELMAPPDDLEGVEFLAKPTTMENLLRTVRRALDQPAAEIPAPIRMPPTSGNGSHPASLDRQRAF